MSVDNILDLADGILSCFLNCQKIIRLDVDISIGIAIRIIFFIIIFFTRELPDQPVGQLVAQFVGWTFFHYFVIRQESQYFMEGEAITYYREYTYKIMDTIQLIIAIIYLLTSIQSELESAIMIIFLINLILNILELLKLWCCGGKEQTNYNVKGGYCEMYCGFLIGILSVIIFLIDAAVRYKDKLENERTWKVFLYLTMIGEIICLIFSGPYFCSQQNQVTWSNERHKQVLGFLYGLSVGLFSVFYGLLTSICIILFVIAYCWTKCDNSGNEVHPE